MVQEQPVHIKKKLQKAVGVLNAGGVIAYPTEHCFGLGCDPQNKSAVERILAIKERQAEQGLILIAANLDQVMYYADLYASPYVDEILSSWPGPNTWLLNKADTVPNWVSGKHSTIAMRITKHDFSSLLCSQFAGVIVSTSANRHGKPALITADEVELEMGAEIDYIVDEKVGGAPQPSIIRDAMMAQRIR